jgi:hypothetical protein
VAPALGLWGRAFSRSGRKRSNTSRTTGMITTPLGHVWPPTDEAGPWVRVGSQHLAGRAGIRRRSDAIARVSYITLLVGPAVYPELCPFFASTPRDRPGDVGCTPSVARSTCLRVSLHSISDHRTWPQTLSTVKIVVPVPPGGANDFVARVLTEQIGRAQGLGSQSRTVPGRAAWTRSRVALRARRQYPADPEQRLPYRSRVCKTPLLTQYFL